MFKLKKEKKKIDRAKGTGEYGMFIWSSGTSRYYIEFEKLGIVKNSNGKEFINVRIVDINIKFGEIIPKHLWDIRWVDNDNDVYWFIDNKARVRDNAINDLLNDNGK